MNSPKKYYLDIRSQETDRDRAASEGDGGIIGALGHGEKNSLGMKKTRMANLAREGGIQRQRLLSKHSTKRITIAESSDSILTDDENRGKKIKRSRKGSSSSSSSQSAENGEYSFNEDLVK